MPTPLATTEELRERCTALPLFPLPRVVFLPHTLLPLHVFEPRYRTLVTDLLEGDRLLGVPMLAPGWRETYDAQPPLHPVLGVGQIVRHQALPDGCSNIVLVGLGRARVVAEAGTDQPYRVVQAELLDDLEPPGGARALSQADTRLKVAVGQLIRAKPEAAEQLSVLLQPERSTAESVDALAHLALRDPGERQAYLELRTVTERVDRVLASIAGMLWNSDAPSA